MKGQILMKAVKLISCLVAVSSLLSACTAGTVGGSDASASDIVSESNFVSEQIEQVKEENSSVEVGEYGIPDASCFTVVDVDNGVSISSYDGEMTAIEIPDSIAGSPVVAIESGAFSNSEVIGVKIPDSVTLIKEKAFYFCMTLVEVEFGNGVQEVGYEAFEGCFALTKVSLNQGLKSIGEMAFGNTPSLVDVSLPDSLEFMGEGAFVLSGIQEITVPGSVKTIEQQVFSTCSNLERIVLEDGVESIKHQAFEDCDNLVSVEIPASVTEIESLAFIYSEETVIEAPKGSVAEAFAEDNGMEFSAQ